MSEAELPLWQEVARLKGAAVVIVGDVMLDHFVYGAVERISPEAPVPVLRHAHASQMLGGAGNVAANVLSLGGELELVAALGDDRDAVEVERLVLGLGVSGAGLVRDAARRTAIKTRFIAHNQQVMRFDSETVAPLAAPARAALEAAFGEALGRAGLVVLSDYGKGVLTAGGAERLIARAREAGRPVLVDPKGVDFRRYAGASYLTPNLKELAEATRMPVESDDDVAAAARTLIPAVGLEAVVATRGEKGLSVVRAGSALHIPAEAREVYDVSGAGDTVVAALALGLARGLPLERAARIANAAAGIAVAKIGTAQVGADELAAALREADGEAGGGADGIDAARPILAEWRRQGLEIGFTNGCFDILHAGHVSLLAQARAMCDRLVVGLNSDGSTRRLKGPTRPVNDQKARATVLRALRSVDLVLLFEEDTPEALIRRVEPDVLVKGADYRIEDVVGGDFVRARGGRVALAELVPGRSTSAIVKRIAGEQNTQPPQTVAALRPAPPQAGEP